MTRPTIVRALGFEPRDHSIATSQNGVVAESSAAVPDASCCSAHASVPYAPANISVPETAACPQCRGAAGSRLAIAHDSSSTPAALQRMPIISSGGIERTARLMARNVDPQIR